MPDFSVTINQAVEHLKKEATQHFIVMMQHGSMQLEYFAPEKIDSQSPHKQDEIYIIASGTSQFYRSGETIDCKTGDVIFVPAAMEHRFVNFSKDFATWVIFYGPEGGEKSGL
ncbi:MAG: cupin domain-containing protein [Bacteroidota bacterium]